MGDFGEGGMQTGTQKHHNQPYCAASLRYQGISLGGGNKTGQIQIDRRTQAVLFLFLPAIANVKNLAGAAATDRTAH